MSHAIEDLEDPARPSKSQRKRDMAALQDLGTELVMLNADQLAQIELPERLCEAIADAQRIRDFEGRRRQMQFIGKLMREVDPAPIRAKLDEWSGVAGAGTAQQRLVERWRERLLGDDPAIALFAAEYPGCDLQRLRSLIASVKRDRALNRTPKNYRELFRAIRDIVAAGGGGRDAP
ncbi:MAG: ribosome biogenesis factor YjgA [Betaproteobacteria bacterium]